MTSRHPAWKRTRLLASSTAIAALTGTLLLTTVPVAQADETTPSISETTSTDSETESFSETQSTSNSTGVLPADAGATIAHNQFEAIGDALGRGYEQRVTLSKTGDGFVQVNIFEPQSRGGGLIFSFSTDVKSEWPQGFVAMNFQGIGLIGKAGLPVNHVAVIGGSVYISEVKTKLNTSGMYSHWDADGSRVHVYNAASGSKQTGWGITVGNEKSVVTAMDAISYGGKDYLAVGLNYRGLRIVDLLTWSEIGSVYEDWAGNADTISAIKFGIDDQGKLLVATSKFTSRDWALWVAEVTINNGKATGTTVSKHNYRPWDANWQWASALAFGKFGVDNTTKLAVGWPSTDRISILHPRSNDNEVARIDSPNDMLTRSLRFFRDADGNNRLAITRMDANTNKSDALVVADMAGSLRVVSPEGLTPTAMAERFVPGYRAMLMDVENRSRDGVQVDVKTSKDPAQGCMIAGIHGGSPAPRSSPLSAKGSEGSTSGVYSLAESLMGDAEGCGTEGKPGVFEVQVALPDGSGTEIAKVVIDHQTRKPQIVEPTVGNGRFAIDIEPSTAPAVAGAALGSWRFVVADRYAAPTAVAAPSLTGKRLTPAAAEGAVDSGFPDDPTRPVYRFTVSGGSWNVPGAGTTRNSLSETVLPAMMAQGSADGGATWDDLGTVIPKAQPLLEGEKVTFGDATFDWQTRSPSATNYTQFRVVNDGLASNVEDATAIPIPDESTVINSIKFTSTNQRVYANGLDQLSASLILQDSSGNAYDTEMYSKLYDRIYFRVPNSHDQGTDLITGLGDPKNPNRSMSVSTVAGAYSSGATQGAAGAMTMNISTTDANAKGPVAVFKPTGTGFNTKSQRLVTPTFFEAVLSTPVVDSGNGTQGLTFGPCLNTERLCKIANPATRPVPFAAGEGKIGLQFHAAAIPGTSSLPLGSERKSALHHRLGYSDLVIDGSTVRLSDGTTFDDSPTISTTVVTHGYRLQLPDVPR